MRRHISTEIFFVGILLKKQKKVLDSLTSAEQTSIAELDSRLNTAGCITLAECERLLGNTLFEKLRAAGMYDINHVSNPSGEFGFVTRPAAFHKFNDPLVDDAFDLAKALVAALAYGMTLSAPGRGKIDMITRLLRKLNSGGTVGPATAIGEDYRVLETKGVIRVAKAKPYGFTMELLKQDIGEMALSVLTRGEVASTNVIDRPLPGMMTGYRGPRQAAQIFA